MFRLGVLGITLALLCIHVQALAVGPQVYSIGSLTAAQAKGRLDELDYYANLTFTSEQENIAIRTAHVETNPVFGLSDVQSGVDRVELKYGASVSSHAHPRASETLYVEGGVVLTHLRLEGISNARVISLILNRGSVTCFPQGLAHSVTCEKQSGCSYVSFYNSADYGIVAAPALPGY